MQTIKQIDYKRSESICLKAFVKITNQIMTSTELRFKWEELFLGHLMQDSIIESSHLLQWMKAIIWVKFDLRSFWNVQKAN